MQIIRDRFKNVGLYVDAVRDKPLASSIVLAGSVMACWAAYKLDVLNNLPTLHLIESTVLTPAVPLDPKVFFERIGFVALLAFGVGTSLAAAKGVDNYYRSLKEAARER